MKQSDLIHLDFVIRMQFGSHVYGTNLPTSDLDIKGVYIPKGNDILLQQVKKTIVCNTKENIAAKNSPEDIDSEIHCLQQYLKLLMEGQTVALDMLFTPAKYYLSKCSSVWMTIQENKARFLHSGVTSFASYCRTQAAKYGIKGSRIAAIRTVLNYLITRPSDVRLGEDHEGLHQLTVNDPLINIVNCRGPNGHELLHLEVCNRKISFHATIKYARDILQKIFDEYGARAKLAEDHNGIDWKALMHAVRVVREAHELLLSGHITFPRPEREILLKIRRGEIPYLEVATMIEQGLEELQLITKTSILPLNPDIHFANELVLQAYREAVKK